MKRPPLLQTKIRNLLKTRRRNEVIKLGSSVYQETHVLKPSQKVCSHVCVVVFMVEIREDCNP